jgi:hypothetical protein
MTTETLACTCMYDTSGIKIEVCGAKVSACSLVLHACVNMRTETWYVPVCVVYDVKIAYGVRGLGGRGLQFCTCTRV